MSAKVDEEGKLIKVSPDGLYRLDGLVMFRRVDRDGVVYLQFVDRDRMRNNCRGTQFVEVPFSVLQDLLGPIESEKP